MIEQQEIRFIGFPNHVDGYIVETEELIDGNQQREDSGDTTMTLRRDSIMYLQGIMILGLVGF